MENSIEITVVYWGYIMLGIMENKTETTIILYWGRFLLLFPNGPANTLQTVGRICIAGIKVYQSREKVSTTNLEPSTLDPIMPTAK